MNAVRSIVPALLLTVLVRAQESCVGIIFEKERINARVIACDTLEINGIYFFINTSSVD